MGEIKRKKEWVDKYLLELSKPDIRVTGEFTNINLFAIKPRPPWEDIEFLERHFERVSDVLVPGMDAYGAIGRDSVRVYRLARKPLTVVVVVMKFSPVRGFTMPDSYLFFRAIWRLFWRRIDPKANDRLREVLEGAVAIDALAGREP